MANNTMNGPNGTCWMILALSLIALAGCNSEETPPPNNVPTHAASDADVPAIPEGSISLETANRIRFEQVLAEQRGKVVLVDFWATWCGPCTKEFPRTVEMARKYRDRGLAVMSVSLDDPASREAVEQFLHQQGATFPNLLSEFGIDDRSFEEFRIDGGAIPHYKLFDRQGNEVRSFISGDPTAKPFTYEEIEAAIQEQLDGA